MRIVVYFKTRHSAVENLSLLVVVSQWRRARPLFDVRSAMAEIPEQLSVRREFLDAVSTPHPRNPHVSLPIRLDGLLAGPAGHIPRPSPAAKEIALGVEFEHRRARHAAIGARRRGGC